MNQDFRLPASTWPQEGASKEPLVEKQDDILEFRFELQKLPLIMPSIRYPSIQFSNSFMFDFKDRFHTSDFDDSHMLDGNSVYMLPKAMFSPTEFSRLDYKNIAAKRLKDPSVPMIILPDSKHHGFQGSFYIIDYFHDFLSDINSNKFVSRNQDIVLDAFMCLGCGVLLNQLYHKIKGHRFKEPANYLADVTKRCMDDHTVLAKKLHGLIADFDQESLGGADLESLSIEVCVIGYTAYFLTNSALILQVSIERFHRLRMGIFPAIDSTYKIAEAKGYITRPVFAFVKKNVHFNIQSILIPSYNPHFLFEVHENLKSLAHIYHTKLSIQDHELSLIQKRLHYQYHTLLEMFQADILPILFLARNEDSVTVYTCTLMFNIAKRWISIFPSEAIVYRLRLDDRYPQESQFLDDLAKTLYMYYYAISVALDAVLPACKYLFSHSFMPRTSQFFGDRKTMTSARDNPYHILLNLATVLQRHNYYSMRLYAFFRRRNCFYLIYIKPSTNFLKYVSTSRFKSRKIVNLLETPIKSFNTTLIRPEHYPTANDGVVVDNPDIPCFTRKDEAMAQKMYTRNIETLNFFESEILQFDHETMLLLRDYRPLDDGTNITLPSVSSEIIQQYIEDRNILMNHLS